MKILTTQNAKIRKGEKLGYLTLGVHLAPSKLSGYNTCLWASNGCAMSCLNTSGHGAFSSVQAARIAKTKMLFQDKDCFMAQLKKEISAAERKAEKAGLKLAIRLNLTSDIPWEKMECDGQTIMEAFPDTTFYDYTKSRARVENAIKGKLPSNYSLTFSRSESNEKEVHHLLALGANVAVVFRGQLPATYAGRPVISGDESDTRFLDPKNVIVGLLQKGKAKQDTTGFVVDGLTS